jgi:nucleoid-associated protein YgaU
MVKTDLPAKLTIKTKPGEQAKGGVTKIEAHFNPNKIVLGKSVKLLQAPAKGRDVPEQQFGNGDPRTFNLDLLFDTYDNDRVPKEPVTVHTAKLDTLTVVSPDLHRPPICELWWGAWGKLFEGVLENLDHEYTLFMEDGTPVRATSKCVFKEYRDNPRGMKEEDKRSSDIAKQRIVRRGDTLSSIAAVEYLDPGLWRPIADHNGLDDPLDLEPGMVLLLPTLTVSRSGRSQT